MQNQYQKVNEALLSTVKIPAKLNDNFNSAFYEKHETDDKQKPQIV